MTFIILLAILLIAAGCLALIGCALERQGFRACSHIAGGLSVCLSITVLWTGVVGFLIA
jgi:hypothetical protein